LLQVANSIHTRDKLVQIVLTFLIFGIVVNWCNSFTKLIGAGGKCTTAGSLSKLFLLYFEPLYLLIYSSYILRSQLWTTRQTTLSITSSIALEEARSTVILCTILEEEEARLTAILGTTECRCLHLFTLDL
jgi:membrane glycosyltransferase